MPDGSHKHTLPNPPISVTDRGGVRPLHRDLRAGPSWRPPLGIRFGGGSHSGAAPLE